MLLVRVLNTESCLSAAYQNIIQLIYTFTYSMI